MKTFSTFRWQWNWKFQSLGQKILQIEFTHGGWLVWL